MQIRAIVLGGGGFIGSHLVKRLRSEGYFVRAVDLVEPRFSETGAHEFKLGDLRNLDLCRYVLDGDFDEVYQLAADMGGAGYLFTGENDFSVMHHSAQINLNVARAAVELGIPKVFFSSSACVYPTYNQNDPQNPICEENSAYPADPDSEYGWEKLFSERLYLNAMRNQQLEVRIARFHNVYGPENDFDSGREKAPAALCRKVAEATDGTSIDLWGNGEQTRSFLYIDDCLEGIRALMQSDFTGPVNIGSEELINLNAFAEQIIRISGKQLELNHVPGPIGVQGRNSDNRLAKQHLNWEPQTALQEGITNTYRWIESRIKDAEVSLQKTITS